MTSVSVIEQIRAAARDFPQRTAHISNERRMSYAELWGRAEALAHHFQQTFSAEGPVVIRGQKEPEMLVTFIGAVLAGRAYVPVDVALPEARFERVLAIAQPVTVLTTDAVAALTTGWESSPKPAPVRHQGEDPFYILFTSGSTGDPKGVVITHDCLQSFVNWQHAEHAFVRGGEVTLNQAPFTFDVSVMDIYCGLAIGSTIFSITKEDVAKPREMYARMKECGATIWVSTPSFAGMCLVEKSLNAEMIPTLRRFWFCGETLPHKTAATLRQRFPQAEVWNTYGPTEATVATTSILVDDALLAECDPLPIGLQMPGTIVEARSPEGRRCADGERGEIVIIGPNVSPGYLRRPDLTERAFFVENGVRGYRTGDRGYQNGARVFFEGRMDFQVKVRGHRIELGDVECHLRDVPGITDAVVLPVERRGVCESLAAFLIMAQREHEDDFAQGQAIRAALAERVPDYMLPRRFEFLPSFPLTANGKADRRELAARLQA